VQIAFEPLAIEGDGKVGAGCHQAVGIGQERGSERNRIAYRAIYSSVKLPNEGDLYQRWPRNTTRHSAGSGLHSGKLIMRK